MNRYVNWRTVVCCLANTLVAILTTLITTTDAAGHLCSLFRGECRTRCETGSTITFPNNLNLCDSPLICCLYPQSQVRRLSNQSASGGKIPYSRYRYQTQPTFLLPSPRTTKRGRLHETTTNRNQPTHNGNAGTCGLPRHVRVRRVVNGAKTARCRYPWMALIDRGSSWDMCGAALISDRHLITAAHCFDNLQNTRPTIIIGEYDRGEIRPQAEIRLYHYSFHRHPDYSNWSYRNDIAIVILNTPIDLSRYECLHPICLPEVDTQLPVGTVCEVAGWGSVQREAVYPPTTSNVLRKTSIPTQWPSICENLWSTSFDKNSQICAGDLQGNTDSCAGDSGGPLMCHDVLGSTTKDKDVYFIFGVVSLGNTKCAQPGVPAVYTDVRQYLPWIRLITGLS